jgi:hypothetical protein
MAILLRDLPEAVTRREPKAKVEKEHLQRLATAVNAIESRFAIGGTVSLAEPITITLAGSGASVSVPARGGGERR